MPEKIARQFQSLRRQGNPPKRRANIVKVVTAMLIDSQKLNSFSENVTTQNNAASSSENNNAGMFIALSRPTDAKRLRR